MIADILIVAAVACLLTCVVAIADAQIRKANAAARAADELGFLAEQLAMYARWFHGTNPEPFDPGGNGRPASGGRRPPSRGSHR